MGADGWVSGLVNAFPEETVAVYRLAGEGRLEEALAIYRWFAPLLKLDVATKLVQNIKLAEALAGVGTETVRAPRLPLAGAERAAVAAIVKEALAARPRIPPLDRSTGSPRPPSTWAKQQSRRPPVSCAQPGGGGVGWKRTPFSCARDELVWVGCPG